MDPKIVNPDSTILQQVDGQWQKLAAMIVWKLAGTSTVRLTAGDMDRFNAEFSPGIPVLLTQGHADAIELQIVDEAAALRIADHDSKMRGSA